MYMVLVVMIVFPFMRMFLKIMVPVLTTILLLTTMGAVSVGLIMFVSMALVLTR